MSPVTESVANGARHAVNVTADAITSLELAIVQLEERATTAERELEDARRETGKQRTRVEQLEEVVRLAVEDSNHLELTRRHTDYWVWLAREALGLDGATGARDIREEVTS